MRYAAIVIFLWCGVTGLALAADKEGRAAIKGAGVGTCKQYLEAREKQTREYYLFGGWLDGYLSGQNQYLEDTFDIAPWQSTDILASFLAAYCDKNPDTRFYQAAFSMVQALREDRLRTTSRLIPVEYGGHKTLIYVEALRRVQRALQDQGMYKGALDGDYGPGTRAALQAYQTKEKIPVTGIPDQETLFHLFMKPK